MMVAARQLFKGVRPHDHISMYAVSTLDTPHEFFGIPGFRV